MKSAVQWFIENPKIANLLAMALILGGLIVIPQTPQETLPNVPLDQIVVASTLAGASPETVEQMLCTPLENAIYGIEGITDIVSESREGTCSITVDVVEGYIAREVRDLIAARVAGLKDLPKDAEQPVVEELIFRNRVARVVLTGDVSPRDLYTAAREMRSRLMESPLISQVEIEGLPSREVSIEVPKENLRRYQLSFSEIAQAIQNDVQQVTGGVLRTAQSEALIQAGEEMADADGYRQVLIRRGGDGDSLYLDRVASITDGFNRDAMGAWFNGQPAAALDVYRIGDQNILDIADAVSEFIETTPLPQGMRLVLWQDDAEEYRGRSETLWSNALQGLIIVMVVLTLFLGFQMSFWVAMGIPVAMVGACILLPPFDVSFNTISLFAFILVLGIVVDDAIVVGESVHESTQRLGHNRAAVIAGANRVANPVVFSVVTTIIAFVPMLFLPGPEGELMRVIPIIAIGILALSLVESLWILPSHLDHAKLNPNSRSEKLAKKVNTGMDRWVHRKFLPVITTVLRWRYAFISGAVGLFITCLVLVNSGWLTLVLFTKVDGERVMAEVIFPQGTSSERIAGMVTSLRYTGRELAKQLEEEYDQELITDILAEQGYRRKISTGNEPDAYRRVRVSLALAPGDRPITADDVAHLWRDLHPSITDAVSVRFHASLHHSTKPDVHINLYHREIATLQQMGQDLQNRLEGLKGVHEVTNSMSALFNQIQVIPKPAAQMYGVTEQMLGQQVAAAFHGMVVDNLPEQDHEVPVVLRLPANESNSMWHLEQLPIVLPDGSTAPLAALAQLEQRETPALISHYDLSRSVTVGALVDPTVTSEGRVMKHLEEEWLGDLAQRYPGASWSIAGKPKNTAELLDQLGVTYLLAIIGMFVVLTIAFGTYWQPFLILLAIPFGLVGSFLGHFFLGHQLSLWSIVGIVAVSGVVVNDNLVLISEVNDTKSDDVPIMKTIRDAVLSRFRSIILTTLTTFVGVAPLILEDSPQARFLIPMAISLAFGVLFATVITLLIVPCFYLAFEDMRALIARFKAKPAATSEQDTVDQAYAAGQAAAMMLRAPTNPYVNDVLRASWEAGMADKQDEGALESPA